MKFNLFKKKKEPETIDAEATVTDVTETPTAEENRKEDPTDGKPKKKQGKIKTYFWGSEENPLPVFSWRAKMKRWYLVHYRGYCYFIVTHYDKTYDEYIYEKECVPRKTIPREAVHVTNQKYTWHLNSDIDRRGINTERDHGFTAHDASLYIRCNKFDEAMKIDLDMKKGIDNQKLLMLIVAIVGAGMFLYFYYMQIRG